MKWTDVHRAFLVVEIERMVKPNEPEHGVEWACRILSRREPWASLVKTQERGAKFDVSEVLRQHFYAARDAAGVKRLVQILREFYTAQVDADTVGQWDDLVASVKK